MNIIPKTFILALLASTGYVAQAQEDLAPNTEAKGFYLRASGGYAFESGKTEFNNADPNGLTGIMQSTDVTVNADGSSVNVKSLNGTVGAGIKLNLTAGYMFNSYIGAELGFNYFLGDDTMIGRLRSPQINSLENTYLEGLDIAPAIYLTPNFKKLNPYTRIGLLIPVAGKLNIETMARQINGGGEGTDIMVEAKTEVKSQFSVGYFGALGVSYPINDQLSVFGEIEIKNLSIESKSAEITHYKTTAITNGESQLVPGQQLADLPVYEKKFEFTDDYNQSTTTTPNQDAPRKIPTQFVNASGTGINLGIKYRF